MTQQSVGESPLTQTPPSAADKASDVAQGAKESGVQVAQTATEQAKSVASEATKQTRNLLGEAQGQLREQADGQQQRVTEGLRSLGDELRSMAEKGEQSGTATELAHQAAQRAHGAADWLDQRQAGDLLGELRQFARRRPGAFLLGALVAGVVAGRLTRGVVAAHSDDGDADVSQTRPRQSAAGLGDDGDESAASGVSPRPPYEATTDVEPFNTPAGQPGPVNYPQSPSTPPTGQTGYQAPADLDQALAADPLGASPRHLDVPAADPLSRP